jgi:hypothetical protein
MLKIKALREMPTDELIEMVEQKKRNVENLEEGKKKEIKEEIIDMENIAIILSSRKQDDIRALASNEAYHKWAQRGTSLIQSTDGSVQKIPWSTGKKAFVVALVAAGALALFWAGFKYGCNGGNGSYNAETEGVSV